MRPESRVESCTYPNVFSEVIEPAVEKRLPERGSISDAVVNHLTGVRSYVETVTDDLCDDQRVGSDTAQSTIGSVSRTIATTAVLTVGAIASAAAVATGGAVLATAGLVGVGLVVAPPLAEKIAIGVARFGKDIVTGIGERLRSLRDGE